MERQRIVITGSTRGLGYELARQFLTSGCAVMVSGRSRKSVVEAAARLAAEHPHSEVRGVPCDVGEYAQVEALWQEAAGAFGGVDHWINNAGIGQPMAPIWDVEPHDMEEIVRTDLLGILHGARVAMRGMVKQGSGSLWFMEGHGSNGRIMGSLSVYGAAKRAVRYVAHALAREAKGTGVLVGTLFPGLMITDFTMSRIDRRDAAQWERTKRVFNIIADRPETVAAFLAPRILSARKTGTHIGWLTVRRIFWRFLTSPLIRRRVMDGV